MQKAKKTRAMIAGLILVAGIAFYAGKVYFFNGRDATSRVAYSPGINTPDPNQTAQNSTLPGSNPPAPAGEPVAGGNPANKRYGWGIKRNNNHQTPEVPKGIASLLAKYDAYWIGDPKRKEVYLTFDEGYENGYTPRILDVLKEQNVKAAFFITGHYLKSQPELVKRMVAEGHIVGNHTVNHPSLPELTREQIKKEVDQLSEDFFKLTGKKMVYLRPPKGEYSERTLAETRELGYYNIFWSLALVDWVPMPGGPEEAYQSVMNNLHNGALILLHAVSKDNTEALERILKDIKAQGYSFKTLDDLVKKGGTT